MNLSRYISQRILKSDDKARISRPIVRIATIGIAVGVALMLVSLAVVKGFQAEIRNKVIGFGSHFQITGNDRNYSRDSQKLLFDSAVYHSLQSSAGVRHVQIFATKPGILETPEALQGAIIKGVGKDFDWTFLKGMLEEGSILMNDSIEKKNELLISSYLANRLKLKLHDKVSLYFFNEEADPRQRNFTISGIYNTGLEDFDKQFIFVDIAHLQRLAGWGIRLELQADSVCYGERIVVGAQAFGGQGAFTYSWTDATWKGEGPHFLQANKDTTLMVIATDDDETIADTSWLNINFENDTSTTFCRPFHTTVRSTDSDSHYIGGYEVLIADYDQLLAADDQLFSALSTKFLQTQKVTDRNPEIFAWLEMLDINVAIIIILMIVISIVNMTSALLIIILERQNMIGTLKALGIEDKPIIQIFIRNAASIIGKGMFWGNVVGLGLIFLQLKFSIFKLNPENYYVDKVPVQFDLAYILALDVGTLVLCVLCMLIPALYVTRISPIKAIRFS